MRDISKENIARVGIITRPHNIDKAIIPAPLLDLIDEFFLSREGLALIVFNTERSS